jgi:HD-GYP domain-containing protein (c-di-GMP phosphodiesterase class II)
MFVAYLLVVPLLRSAKVAEEIAVRYPGLETELLAAYLEPPARGTKAAPPFVQPPMTPIEAGYAGLVLQRLTVHTRDVLGASEVCLMVREDHAPHRLRTVAEQGIGAESILEAPPPRHRIASIAMADGRPIAFPARPHLPKRASDSGPWSARATVIATPLLWHGQVRGVLSAAIRMPKEGRLDSRHVHLLEDLGGVAGQALEHELRRELTNGDVSTEVRVLLQALRRKDADTREHWTKVVSLARIVGSQLELDGVSAYELELTAALHDVGKLRVPSSILDHPQPLSPRQSDVLHMHPLWGFEMVAGIPGLEPIAPLVRAHHERWDGLGYPDGLGGERIPLASRIIAACEALVTLPIDRLAERRGRISVAFDEFVEGAGTQFDPTIVGVIHRTLVSPEDGGSRRPRDRSRRASQRNATLRCGARNSRSTDR